MIDCSDFRTYGNDGCNGGYQALAYLYSDDQPIMATKDYGRYTAEDQTCSYDSSKGLVKASGFSYITYNSPGEMQAAVMQGPISAAIYDN